MSEVIPERADVRQLRIQAKELLRALQSGNEVADGLDPKTARLSDAQRLVARKYGFDSWPKLVEKLETPVLLDRMKNAIETGDADALEKLLKSKPALRKHINVPMFSFDSQPILRASGHENAARLLPVLVRYGADPNIRSKWWAGGFGALDQAKGETVELLLQLGAKFDVWSAAAHGRIDVLRELLDADPALVNAPGGDGQRPLHVAVNAEVAEFLIDRGADLEVKDIDHEGTPIQYQVRRPEIVRVLLDHGAKPDIFTAVALRDLDLVRKVLAADPSAADARVGDPPFQTVHSDGGHIYIYVLGPVATPYQIAAQNGDREILEELLRQGSPERRLVAAAWAQDGAVVRALLAAEPDLGQRLGPDARAIADAAQQGRTETVRLLLEAGVDPTTPGMDSGSALHVASWFGHADVVKLLAGVVPLDLVDAYHGSPPLGWAAHGAQHCRNPKGDYVAVVEALLSAGADPNVPANRSGTTMLNQSGDREDVKAVLRRHIVKPD